MPIHFIANWISSQVPSEYYAALGSSFVAISLLKTWARGPKLLDIEQQLADKGVSIGLRDLHGRVILVASGGFTPLGLVTLASLAHRGAQIIALTATHHSSRIVQLIQLLRDSTRNELIYAEECDLQNLDSISQFTFKWNLGQDGRGNVKRRLDVVLFLPPDECVYSIGETVQPSSSHGSLERAYTEEVLGRMHLVNTLLPSLLLLPPEREIRIVSVIRPWYAAGLDRFDQIITPLNVTSATVGTASTTKKKQKKKKEDNKREKVNDETIGNETEIQLFPFDPSSEPWRIHAATSLRWLAITREMQSRLDLLAEADTRPIEKLPGIDPTITPITSSLPSLGKPRKSNISMINVCTGFERNSDILSFLTPPIRQREVDLLGQLSDEEKEEEEEDKRRLNSKPDSETETLLAAEKLKKAIDPRPQLSSQPRKRNNQSTATTTATDKSNSLSNQPEPNNSSSSSSNSNWLSTPTNILRYLVILILWPFIWILTKSPATASESIVWAITKPIESELEHSSRTFDNNQSSSALKSPSSSSPSSKKPEISHYLIQFKDNLRSCELYREGRLIRPPLPSRFLDPDTQLNAYTNLWNQEEQRIESIIGSIQPPFPK